MYVCVCVYVCMCVCVCIILAVSSNASVVSANGSGDNQQRQNLIVRVCISIIVISSSMYSTMKAILGKLYISYRATAMTSSSLHFLMANSNSISCFVGLPSRFSQTSIAIV